MQKFSWQNCFHPKKRYASLSILEIFTPLTYSLESQQFLNLWMTTIFQTFRKRDISPFISCMFVPVVGAVIVSLLQHTASATKVDCRFYIGDQSLAFSIAAPKHYSTSIEVSSMYWSIHIEQCIYSLPQSTGLWKNMTEPQNLGEFDAHVAKRYQVSK